MNKNITLLAINGKIGSGKDTVGRIIQYLTSNDCSKSCLGLLKLGDNIEGYHNSNWQIKKFASKLKQIVSILTGIPVEDLEKQEVKNALLGEQWVRYGFADGFYRYLAGSLEGETVMNNKECTKELYEAELKTNWQTSYKTEYTPRILLQYIGTDLFRKQLLENIWVNALFADYKKPVIAGLSDWQIEQKIKQGTLGYPNWIITDMRFPNELKAVKDRGGITIRVERNREKDCNYCGKTIKEQKKGCNEISCYRQFLKNEEHISETALDNAQFDIVIYNNGTIDELVDTVHFHLKQIKII